MPELVLGPMLRYLDETEATVWVETDAPCEVEVLGRSAPTFRVGSHHYAVVPITGLEPGTTYEYELALDGERRWPPPESEFPRSAIRTTNPEEKLELVFGSCRVAVPHEAPYNLSIDEDERGREVDALVALAHRVRELPREEWPDLLLLLGDQVYADEDAPRTREFIRSRRDTSAPPHEEVADFEEYTRLYWESWGDPTIRWLFSTAATAMIHDDHDVHDDWNISASWLEEFEAKPWWQERITGALMSYWVYQHLGNLSPAELESNELLAELHGVDDGQPLLRRFATEWDAQRDGSRWSHARTLGRTKLLVLDAREGRVLGEGRRAMFDEAEWEWIEREIGGDHDHLLLANTLPVLMAPTLHHGEAWNEAVCAGAWGRLGERLFGERLRRALDLEHWAAFQSSLQRLIGMVGAVARGEHGRPPATIVFLGGDVHHAFLAEAELVDDGDASSAVYQAVCSPFRNALNRRERAAARIGASHLLEGVARLLARSAGVKEPPIRWRLVQPPTFDNQFATIELDGRSCLLRIEKTVPGTDPAEKEIATSLERRLA